MRFLPTDIEGAFVIELDVRSDERGSFARTFCKAAFADAGIVFEVVQANISRNSRKSTMRGLHAQRPPHGEPKIVQCIRGSVFDVAVDLRESSPTCGRHVAVELNSRGNRLFYIPIGCAHGFLTLEDDSDLCYLMGAPFVADASVFLRWNDPTFAIDWPAAPKIISVRDASAPNFSGFFGAAR